MKKTVKVIIDEKEVHAPPGINLLDAAEIAGIHIPHLCYLKGLKSIGACRLCLVEIEGLKAPVIACNTKVKDGMVVKTQTEKLLELRRFIIELILSMHPSDCLTCTKAGICELQKYAYELTVKGTSFTKKRFGYEPDVSNPFIKRQPDYCIFCSRCIRICKEQGTAVLNFIGRGIESKVTTPNDKPLQESNCTFCGSCIDVCPVNAIVEADRQQRGREWEYQKIKSACLLCGCGCDIVVSVKDGIIQKITPAHEEGSVERYICAYGRFGFDWVYADSRIKSPLKRVNDTFQEIQWQEAVSLVSEKLKNFGKQTGFISTANLMNEDAFVLKKFIKDVAGTEYFDTTVSLYSDISCIAKSQNVEIENADLVILVDLDPSQKERLLPAFDVFIRRKVARGARLITFNASHAEVSEVATLNLLGDPALTVKQLLKALISRGLKGKKELESAVQKIKYVRDDVNKAAQFIIESNNPVILTSPRFFQLSSNIALLKGRIVCIGLEANCYGIARLGMNGGKKYGDIINSGLKMLYIVGEVPLKNRPDGVDFLVVQHSHLTELASEADLVLPATTFFESSGSIIDWSGRIKHLSCAIKPLGHAKTHREIFISVAKQMGISLKQPSPNDLKRLINGGKINGGFFKKSYNFDINSPELIELMNSSLLNDSRLRWLKQIEKNAEKIKLKEASS